MGFNVAERAAMKERAVELRAERKEGTRMAEGSRAVLDTIASMASEDRALGERVHVAEATNAPALSRQAWYGVPACANAQGKVVISCEDDGDLSPTTYAVVRWSPAVEQSTTASVSVAVA